MGLCTWSIEGKYRNELRGAPNHMMPSKTFQYQIIMMMTQKGHTYQEILTYVNLHINDRRGTVGWREDKHFHKLLDICHKKTVEEQVQVLDQFMSEYS
jgi:hypothetical protein